MKSKMCASAYQSFQAPADSMGYKGKRFRSWIGHGEYDNKTFRLVLAAHGTTYAPYLPYTQHRNAVAKCMIQTITEKAWSMMIDFQVPLVFGGEAVSTAIYLHQWTPHESITNRADCDGYQTPYQTPYEMLHAFGKPSHTIGGNDIS